MVFRPNQLAIGRNADTGISDSLPYKALEPIEGGRILCFNDTYDAVRYPMANISTITMSADLVASDVFTLNVNGTNISVTYATSHNATMTAIATAIETADPDLTATVSAARVITVRAIDTAVLATTNALVTSGGAGTAVASVVYSSDDASRLAGISKDEGFQPTTAGVPDVNKDNVVQVATKGRYAVQYEGTITPASTVYVRIEEENGDLQKRGMLKQTVGSPVVAVAVSGLKIREVVSGENTAVIDINLP